jgi:hypothetical protein
MRIRDPGFFLPVLGIKIDFCDIKMTEARYDMLQQVPSDFNPMLC